MAGTFTSQQAEKQRNGEFQCLLTFLLFLVCYIQNPSPTRKSTFRLFLLPIANPVWMLWQACLTNLPGDSKFRQIDMSFNHHTKHKFILLVNFTIFVLSVIKCFNLLYTKS